MNVQPGRIIPLSVPRQQFRRMRNMGGDIGKRVLNKLSSTPIPDNRNTGVNAT
jgi:hypothetical protein